MAPSQRAIFQRLRKCTTIIRPTIPVEAELEELPKWPELELYRNYVSLFFNPAEFVSQLG